MHILEILNEDTLSYGGTRPAYLTNLIALIDAGKPLSVEPASATKYGKTVVIDPSILPILKRILQTTEMTSKGYLETLNGKIPPLPIKDKPNETILYTKIEKTGNEGEYVQHPSLHRPGKHKHADAKRQES